MSDRNVEYHWKHDGWLRVDTDGSCRYLTLWEHIKLLFGGKP